MKRFMIILLTVLLMVSLVSGCKATDISTESLSERHTVKYVAVPVYDAVFVGIEKGFFDKRNIDIELVTLTTGGPNIIQVVSSGSADAGLSAIMSIINAINSEMPIIGVTDFQSSMPDYPLKEFFVKSDSGINSVADLKGKTVAVNTLSASFHYAVLMAMTEAGLSEDDVEFVTLPFPEQVVALENSQVDMIGLMQPHNGRVRNNPDIKMLMDGEDIFGQKQFSLHLVNST